MNYVSEIAALIVAKKRDAAPLGAETYTAIAEWEKLGIPADVVIEAIEEVFSAAASHGGTPIEVLQEAVGRGFAVWLSTGGTGALPQAA